MFRLSYVEHFMRFIVDNFIYTSLHVSMRRNFCEYFVSISPLFRSSFIDPLTHSNTRHREDHLPHHSITRHSSRIDNRTSCEPPALYPRLACSRFALAAFDSLPPSFSAFIPPPRHARGGTLSHSWSCLDHEEPKQHRVGAIMYKNVTRAR